MIEHFFAPLTYKAPGAKALQDDAATYKNTPGLEQVVTCDALVENVHFLPQTRPDLLARKMLGVNLSDIAAMGAIPRYYLMSAMVNASVDASWMRAFSSELALIQEDYDIVLLGGDTVRYDGPLSFSVTVMGEVESSGALRRGHARATDKIYVTGTLGDAAFGLDVLQKTRDVDIYDHLITRYHSPQPRIETGRLIRSYASAATDISDGLCAELMHMLRSSDQNENLGAVIYQDTLPLSPQAKDYVECYPDEAAKVYSGGDDYELLFTIPAEMHEAFERNVASHAVRVTQIGEMTDRGELEFYDSQGVRIYPEHMGYVHNV